MIMDEKENFQETLSRGVLALVVGASLLFAGYWAGRQLHTVWNVWPVVDGMVTGGTVAEVMEVPAAKGDGQFHQYEPTVSIRYQVRGQEYNAELSLGYTTATHEKASANLQSHYATGTHQPIRYNPQDPKDVRFGSLATGPLAFAFLLILAGVMLGVNGTGDLAKAYLLRFASAPEMAKEAVGAALPFDAQKPTGAAAATIRCATCGRIVEAGQDTCPNCLKALRAA
jgi:hypothetical protein